jgi:biopolymer transport protein ExbD
MQMQEDKPYDDINITPMLDLAYVLLVIFIIMTTASVQGMKVDLPSGSTSTKLVEKKTVVISVSNTGSIGVDATPVSMGELETRLRGDLAGAPDMNVVLKGDRGVQYQKVMDVLDLCGRLGIRSIGLATQRSAA